MVQFATQRLQKAAARMAMRSEAATQTLKVGSPGGHSSKNSSSKRQRAAQEDDSGVNEQQEQAGKQIRLLCGVKMQVRCDKYMQ